MSRSGFTLTEAPELSRWGAARGKVWRRSPQQLTTAWQTGTVFGIDQAGRAPIASDFKIVHRPASEIGIDALRAAVYLGVDSGTAYWTIAADAMGKCYPVQQGWSNLQEVGHRLSDLDCGLFTAALAFLEWRKATKHCPACGGKYTATIGGRMLRCLGCSLSAHPRMDPAVICLVESDTQTHVLIGQKPRRPNGWASLPAGFIESGESPEAAVIREVYEELGIHIHGTSYLGSQPWPFPQSLLLAFSATADMREPIDTSLAGEFTTAHWIPREMVLNATSSKGATHGLSMPPPTSIGTRMLKDWANN